MNYNIVTNHKINHAKIENSVKKRALSTNSRPIPKSQLVVFEAINTIIKTKQRPIKIDSCCGTGMSSYQLAKSFPNHWIIGIDQSKERLSRFSKRKPSNLLFVRANIYDFCRLINSNHWNVDSHTIFYPNPWPKLKHLTRRVYGNPSFKEILDLSPILEVRSNWEQYLLELKIAVLTIYPTARISISHFISNDPISLFEMKYFKHNSPCFRCIIEIDKYNKP